MPMPSSSHHSISTIHDSKHVPRHYQTLTLVSALCAESHQCMAILQGTLNQQNTRLAEPIPFTFWYPKVGILTSTNAGPTVLGSCSPLAVWPLYVLHYPELWALSASRDPPFCSSEHYESFCFSPTLHMCAVWGSLIQKAVSPCLVLLSGVDN